MQLHHLNSPLYILFDSCDNKVLRLSQVCLLGSIAQAQSLLLAHRFSSPCNKYSSRNFCSQADTACNTDRRACRGDAEDSESEEWYRLHVRKTVLRSSSRRDLNRTFLIKDAQSVWHKYQAEKERFFLTELAKKPLAIEILADISRTEGKKQKGKGFNYLFVVKYARSYLNILFSLNSDKEIRTDSQTRRKTQRSFDAGCQCFYLCRS